MMPFKGVTEVAEAGAMGSGLKRRARLFSLV